MDERKRDSSILDNLWAVVRDNCDHMGRIAKNRLAGPEYHQATHASNIERNGKPLVSFTPVRYHNM
jgi:hypothetical protein